MSQTLSFSSSVYYWDCYVITAIEKTKFKNIITICKLVIKVGIWA